MKRGLLLGICALVIAAPVAWLGGEQHRENCIRAQRTACSVLPWEAGKVKPAEPRNGGWGGTYGAPTNLYGAP